MMHTSNFLFFFHIKLKDVKQNVSGKDIANMTSNMQGLVLGKHITMQHARRSTGTHCMGMRLIAVTFHYFTSVRDIYGTSVTCTLVRRYVYNLHDTQPRGRTKKKKTSEC